MARQSPPPPLSLPPSVKNMACFFAAPLVARKRQEFFQNCTTVASHLLLAHERLGWFFKHTHGCFFDSVRPSSALCKEYQALRAPSLVQWSGNVAQFFDCNAPGNGLNDDTVTQVLQAAELAERCRVHTKNWSMRPTGEYLYTVPSDVLLSLTVLIDVIDFLKLKSMTLDSKLSISAMRVAIEMQKTAERYVKQLTCSQTILPLDDLLPPVLSSVDRILRKD